MAMCVRVIRSSLVGEGAGEGAIVSGQTGTRFRSEKSIVGG